MRSRKQFFLGFQSTLLLGNFANFIRMFAGFGLLFIEIHAQLHKKNINSRKNIAKNERPNNLLLEHTLIFVYECRHQLEGDGK